VASGSLELMLGPGEQWPAPPVASHKYSRAAASQRARERFERAARLEASAPGKALTLYDDLAQSRGPWSANALYAQARLEFERGARAKAKALLLRYLQRYPSGVNALDVRKLLREIDARPE
jgi:Tfp pilus assembly protein PilF